MPRRGNQSTLCSSPLEHDLLSRKGSPDPEPEKFTLAVFVESLWMYLCKNTVSILQAVTECAMGSHSEGDLTNRWHHLPFTLVFL